MVNANSRITPILEWRTALMQLPDPVFLDLMRIYLGDIKTPFNKQALLEQLGAFLRVPEHIGMMCSFLNDADCYVITAVSLLVRPTFERISQLLSGCIPGAKILGVIQSLEERLVLYRVMRNDRYELAVNPYAAEKIAAFVRPELLFPALCGTEPAEAHRSDPAVPFAGDLLLAGIFCAFYPGLDILKLDGAFKKKPLESLSRQFPDLFLPCSEDGHLFSVPVESAFDVLFRALLNLQLLQRTADEVKPNYRNWHAFAGLRSGERFLYIASAASGRKPQAELAADAAVLRRFALSLPPSGCSPEEARRLFYLVREESRPATGGTRRQNGVSRLSLLLDMQNREPGAVRQQDTAETDGGAKMLAAAAALGILQVGGNRVYRNDGFLSPADEDPPPLDGCVMADPSGILTVFPGLPLAELLPVMQFVTVESVQTAGTFSLSKKSAAAAFAAGFTAERITGLLSRVTRQPVSQNIAFSLHDWFEAYSRSTLYRGFVLCISPEHISLVENNPGVKPYIAKILAPGVYLLSVSEEREALAVLAAGGIDIPGIVSGAPAKEPAACTPLPPVAAAEPFTVAKSDGAALPAAPTETPLDHDNAVARKIASLEMGKEQQDALQSLIQRRVVLSPEQLSAAAVRFERNEARGVDFLGKVHLAESAAAENSMLEITYTENGNVRTICGRPVPDRKTTADVFVKIYPDSGSVFRENTEKPVVISLARARSVRKISRSVFSGYNL